MQNITTQKQLDNLVLKGIKAGEEVSINASLKLGGILNVSGNLTINKPLDSNLYEGRYVRASGSATVEAWDSATVEAWDSATVEAWGSATVRASGSATVRASGSATVEASDSATVSLLGFAIAIIFPGVKFELKSDFAKVITRDQVFKTKKKTTVYKKLFDGYIATLELPKGAIFQSQSNAKCRTSSVKVIKIEDKDGKSVGSGRSQYDPSFIYKVGSVVSATYDEHIASKFTTHELPNNIIKPKEWLRPEIGKEK
jgi:hypothetical protein